MSAVTKRPRAVQTDVADTVIRHLETGTGQPVVLLPGWSQTVSIFEHQFGALSPRWLVVAVDHRGHGGSPAPATGYHLHRLAADLHAVLCGRGFRRVHLVGHSMGAAVAWSYLELYGAEGLATLVLVDQMPCALRNPGWSEEQARIAGAGMTAEGLFAFTDELRGDGPDPRPGFLRDVTSPGLPRGEVDRLIEQGTAFDRRHAADLIFDVATHDWRGLLPHIAVPTLVVAGDSVNVALESQQWMAAQIPDAEFALVRATAGGTHFPFVESPSRFNAVLTDFLSRHR